MEMGIVVRGAKMRVIGAAVATMMETGAGASAGRRG
jgi:aromatic ring hydroxylase